MAVLEKKTPDVDESLQQKLLKFLSCEQHLRIQSSILEEKNTEVNGTTKRHNEKLVAAVKKLGAQLERPPKVKVGIIDKVHGLPFTEKK